jgi:hypothetical protein
LASSQQGSNVCYRYRKIQVLTSHKLCEGHAYDITT